MKRHIRNFLHATVTAGMLVPLAACGVSGEPIHGQVLEAGTSKPIPGAIVIVRWQGTYSAIADSKTACYHVETAITDAQGRYTTPAWHEGWKGPFFSPGAWLEDAYKPGYVRSDLYFRTRSFRNNVDLLELVKPSRDEFFNSIRTAGIDCESAGDSRRKLLPLYRDIYKRLSALAVTKNDNYVANTFLDRIEHIELPEAEADKRNLKRLERIDHDKN